MSWKMRNLVLRKISRKRGARKMNLNNRLQFSHKKSASKFETHHKDDRLILVYSAQKFSPLFFPFAADVMKRLPALICLRGCRKQVDANLHAELNISVALHKFLDTRETFWAIKKSPFFRVSHQVGSFTRRATDNPKGTHEAKGESLFSLHFQISAR